MGLFDSVIDSISSAIPNIGGGGVQDFVLGPFNPGGQLDILGGSQGLFGQFLADPMDLFGVRAEQTRDEVSGILESSAQSGIDAQEAQRERIRQMYNHTINPQYLERYRNYRHSPRGGEIDYTPSKLYEYQKKTGERNIKRQLAAGGLSQSSASKEKLSTFNLGIAQEEMDRLYSGELSRLQLGTGAADAVNAASRSLGGNVSGLYTNLGGGLNDAQRQFGESRQSAYQGLASSLSGMAQYMQQGQGA